MKKLFIVGLVIGIWSMGNTPIEARDDGICFRHAPVRAILAGRSILRRTVQRIPVAAERIAQRVEGLRDNIGDTICTVNIIIKKRLQRALTVGRNIVYRAGQRVQQRPLLRSLPSCR